MPASEFNQKLTTIRDLLLEKDLDALILKRVSSFAWATCGAASYVNTATTLGDSSLVILRDRNILFTQNNEASRLEDEEMLRTQGWEFQVKRWDSDEDPIGFVTRGMKLGADCDFPRAQNLTIEMARIRSKLGKEEQQRLRSLGKDCADSMREALDFVKPGQTEFEIAASLSKTARSRGILPIVNLIATDERVFKYRHPLPTSKKMDRYAMLVMCGRRQGLIISITRLIHFGRISAELQKKIQAIVSIDAEMIHATIPDRTLGEIYNDILGFYDKYGYGEEWKLHHQGGILAYEPREFKAAPGVHEKIQVGQGVAWNPSIAGVKSEDTILVEETGVEILTSISEWPMIEIELDKESILRPGIKEVL